MSVNDEDDDAWIDALRGRPRPGTDPVTAAQAVDLRRAFQEQRRQDHAAAASAADDDPGLQKLLFRLRRERLMDAPAGVSAAVGARWRLPAAAAAVVLLGVVLTVGRAPAPEDDALRGSGAVQVLTVADVPVTRDRLAAQLRAGGATVTSVDLGQGAVEIAATVPATAAAAVAPTLAALGLRAPGVDGALRIELRPQRSAP